MNIKKIKQFGKYFILVSLLSLIQMKSSAACVGGPRPAGETGEQKRTRVLNYLDFVIRSAHDVRLSSGGLTREGELIQLTAKLAKNALFDPSAPAPITSFTVAIRESADAACQVTHLALVGEGAPNTRDTCLRVNPSDILPGTTCVWR